MTLRCTTIAGKAAKVDGPPPPARLRDRQRVARLAHFVGSARPDHQGHAPRSRPAALRWLIAALLMFMMAMPGCSGCRRAAPPKKKVEKPKLPFEMPLTRTLPNDLEISIPMAKPGHWSMASVEAVSNLADFRGDVATDGVALEEVPYRLITSRPALLPKEQTKRLDLIFFLPAGASTSQGASSAKNNVNLQLQSRGSSRAVESTQFRPQGMPAHQFYILVLASEPDEYKYLNALPSIKVIDSGDSSRDNYVLLAPRVENHVPLSSNPLTWTSLAYIIWDDFDPELLTRAQQGALLDWLHWGGQLVISGPESLDRLRGSFLEAYLPATSEGTAEIKPAQMAQMDRGWTDTKEPWNLRNAWSGEQLSPALDSQTLISGPEDRPLVIEKRVGRGRTVVTAFRLNQLEIKGWSGCDAFLSDCLLRRTAGTIADARRNSQLRLFSRDSAIGNNRATWIRYGSTGLTESSFDPLSAFAPSDNFDDMNRVTAGPGVCGWDDRNGVANAARTSLVSAAKITIPDAAFVVRVLAIYLIVLVPVNWGLFRAIRRVEWAWIAAPLISIAFALVVVRLAQLDIGFVRSRTEIGVIELHAGHPSAHMTRYTALYTSLSTNYGVTFDDSSALIQPFSAVGNETAEEKNQIGRALGGVRTTVSMHTGGNVQFDGYRVASNSTGMLHSEHMMEMDGAITVRLTRTGGHQLRNGTSFVLRDAQVVGPDGKAFLGTLEPGDTAVIDFSSSAGRPVTDATRPALEIDRLLEVAASVEPGDGDSGELRLVAWTDETVPGMNIEPAAKQRRAANVVVAHLQAGAIPLPDRLADK